MKNKVYMGGGVGGKTIPTLSTDNLNIKKEIKLKIFCLKCLENSIYRNIFYMCFNRGFCYKKEIEKILFVKITNQIDLLQENGIIQEININKDFSDFLYSQNGFNYHNVQKVKIYAFTSFGSEIFDKYKNYINSKANLKIKKYFEKENNSKKEIEAKKKLRYKIIKMKSPSLRTFEDNILLAEMEK